MKIAVCDDNEMVLKELEEQLDAFNMGYIVSAFSSLKTFLLSVNEGNRYDAVLMDIEWDSHITGMDAASELHKLSPETKIIYITGHIEQYSQQIFLRRTNLSGYLTKPIDTELLKANIDKVADAKTDINQSVLVLNQRKGVVAIPCSEIFYLESRGHTLLIFSGKEPQIFYTQLKKVIPSLPEGFFQCHKSYVINMRQIQRFTANDILLKNGKTIPVSRSKYQAAKEAYFKFIGLRACLT